MSLPGELNLYPVLYGCEKERVAVAIIIIDANAPLRKKGKSLFFILRIEVLKVVA